MEQNPEVDGGDKVHRRKYSRGSETVAGTGMVSRGEVEAEEGAGIWGQAAYPAVGGGTEGYHIHEGSEASGLQEEGFRAGQQRAEVGVSEVLVEEGEGERGL